MPLTTGGGAKLVLPSDGVMVLAGRLAGGDPLTSKQYTVHAPILEGDYGYWQALSDAWKRPGVLVSVEHDMEFSDDLVRGLVDCPHPLCTYPYRCWLKGLGHYVYPPSVDGRFVEAGCEWADTSSLGFVKIAAEARGRPLRRILWKYVEHSVCEAVTGFSQVDPSGQRRSWHVHWPEIRHLHDYDSEALERMSDWERFCLEAGVPCHVKPSEVDDVRSVGIDDAVRQRQLARFGTSGAA